APGSKINGGTYVIPAAFGSITAYPYGDFLMHNLGTGDGILQATPEHYGRQVFSTMTSYMAKQNFESSHYKIRTAPLWGVRFRPRLMHDGESLTLEDAILRHRGEASDVTKKFEKLSRTDKDALLDFLRSL